MSRGGRWFLPETPDVLGILGRQLTTTVEGLDALVAWAGGETAAADAVRAAEQAADESKRELREALTTAFTTPMAPEDIFQLSLGLDNILNGAKNTVREAEVMRAAPDRAIVEMARELAAGVGCLARAFEALSRRDPELATRESDGAITSQRNLERVYREAMSALVESADLHEVAARRELYRRLSRTSDDLVEVAERIWYAILKER